jgi:hypothetical protein
MTAPSVNQNQDNKPSDKELNFRQLENRYEKQLQQERAARMDAERIAQERSKAALQENDDDDDSEPYVDKKKLDKKLARHGEQTRQQTSNQINEAVHTAIKEERKQAWIKNNPDFYETLQHAEKFAQADPELAETILEMPEGFERQKLVYKSIKALGINKPILKEPSIQEKIDANRRSPFYQPTSVGSAPYSSQGDFSLSGQKEAYAKMQELKNRLRL